MAAAQIHTPTRARIRKVRPVDRRARDADRSGPLLDIVIRCVRVAIWNQKARAAVAPIVPPATMGATDGRWFVTGAALVRSLDGWRDRTSKTTPATVAALPITTAATATLSSCLPDFSVPGSKVPFTIEA